MRKMIRKQLRVKSFLTGVSVRHQTVKAKNAFLSFYQKKKKFENTIVQQSLTIK